MRAFKLTLIRCYFSRTNNYTLSRCDYSRRGSDTSKASEHTVHDIADIVRAVPYQYRHEQTGETATD